LRRITTIRIEENIFSTFTKYASLKKPRKAYKVWEDALTAYMEDNPVDGLRMVVRQITDSVPNKRDSVRMKTISRKLELFMRLIDNMSSGETTNLEEKLLSWIAKGDEVDKPSDEFLDLLEKALGYVKD